jgi:hypothetical protein
MGDLIIKKYLFEGVQTKRTDRIMAGCSPDENFR